MKGLLRNRKQNAGRDGHPCGTNGNSMFSDIQASEVFAPFIGLLNKALTWGDCVGVRLAEQERQQEAILQQLSSLKNQLDRIESAQGDLQEKFDPVWASLARLEGALTKVSQENATHEHNLEQVRTQSEGLTRRFEDLSSELIERQVRDPLFKEFIRICGPLAAKAKTGNGDEDAAILAEGLGRLLDTHGLRLLRPGKGAKFNPKEHQPLKYRLSSTKKSHGTIAKLYSAGLAAGSRIIQAARVEVYRFEASTKNQPKNPDNGDTES